MPYGLHPPNPDRTCTGHAKGRARHPGRRSRHHRGGIAVGNANSEAPHTADVLGLSVTERNELPELQRGEGLWRVDQRAFVVRHLVTDGELELFDTNARMMS